jgi:Na+-translocating ferredoxin:NAD+ oxidoreductase RnfG subunit
MKKLESSLTNMVLVLTGVAVIMGGILAYVNHLTEGPIAQQKEKALADGIKTVMPKARIRPISSIRYRMPNSRISVLLSRVPQVASAAT